MSRTVKFYNTLTRQLENFEPIIDGQVSLYSCGPTVYSTPHIGNMRAYSFVDLLVRFLVENNYKVNNLINITDVGHLTSDADEGDDKMEKAAKAKKISAYDIAEHYTNTFYRYIDLLNIRKPNMFPKATNHINEQIDMIKELEEKGFTYLTKDGVYFDTSKFDSYAELSRLDINGLREGERVDFGEKRNKTDFALWKFSPINEQRDMEWESPWGKGFPGWHIECSAMARKHLGDQIDIHTGGIDHIPIHHTNEIAQTESITNKKFVNYWMHVNFLQLLPEEEQNVPEDPDAEIKMSKSKGTAYTVDQIIEKGYDPLILKFFYLSGHYRNELKFNFSILDNQKQAFQKLRNKVYEMKMSEWGNGVILTPNEYSNKFLDILSNDLDTPNAFAYFYEVLNNKDILISDKLTLISTFDNITGLNLLSYSPNSNFPENIKKLAEERLLARKLKHWEHSDILRDEIKSLGYDIKDDKDGYTLSKI